MEVDDLQTLVMDSFFFLNNRTCIAKWLTAEGVTFIPFIIPQDNSANGTSQKISPKYRNSRRILCLW